MTIWSFPDASGSPVSLKSLFNSPRDLMAALIRGGWIIPGEPDRSMFLVGHHRHRADDGESSVRPMSTCCRIG